jgi:mannose-6-phosphate isomerase-like protein (cupin superfamily)
MSYHDDVAELARPNTDFRRVLYTTDLTQLVIMTIPPDGEIGEEVHEGIDQVLSIVDGSGETILDDVRSPVTAGTVLVVPAGTKHNVVASGDGLKLFTVYAPPDHAPGTVHHTKAEADADEHDVPPGSA